MIFEGRVTLIEVEEHISQNRKFLKLIVANHPIKLRVLARQRGNFPTSRVRVITTGLFTLYLYAPSAQTHKTLNGLIERPLWVKGFESSMGGLEKSFEPNIGLFSRKYLTEFSPL